MTGTFRMQPNGPGGTVNYSWIYKDTNGSGQGVVTTHSGSLVVAAGAVGPFSITDSYVHPNSAGTVYLVFSSPWYTSSSLQQPWTCR
jgi:hypothetical protein